MSTTADLDTADPRAAAPRGRLAYVLSRFPYLPETFTLREMLGLEALGWEVGVYALQHQRDAVKHPEALRLEQAARFVEPFAARTWQANARQLARTPTQYTRLLAQVAWGNLGSLDFLLKDVAVFPGAVALAGQMRADGVRHIHAQYGTHAALVALVAADLLGIGYSFTVHAHDLYVDRTMLAEKIRRARFVATISEFNQRWLRQLAGPVHAHKIHVVRCGVDPAAYPFVERPPRPPGAPLSILAVGSLQAYKGHARLIQACAELRAAAPDLRFTCEIAGGGVLRPELEALIAQRGLADVVRVLGPRDQHAVQRLMQAADVLVLPSVVAANGQMEGIPVVLMEALASGLPVVATRLSGIPEAVRPGETGLLVPPDDPVAIRDAVLDVWRNPSAAQGRARQGRALVEAEYNLRLNAERLSDLFGQVLGAPAPAVAPILPAPRPAEALA